MIRLALCVAFWALYCIFAAPIGFVLLFLTGKIDAMWEMAMWGARGGLWLAGVRVRAEGRELLDPKQTYLFMSNHVSNLDPPSLVPLLNRRISIMAKRELFSIPVFGRALRAGSMVPVDRANREAAIESVRKASEVLRSGLGMLVYPEGTRSKDGRLLPFKKGPFHLAKEAGVPVVPITMVGTYEAWPKGRAAIRAGEVVAKFHPPIDPAQYSTREELLQAVRDAIASGLPEKYRS